MMTFPASFRAATVDEIPVEYAYSTYFSTVGPFITLARESSNHSRPREACGPEEVEPSTQLPPKNEHIEPDDRLWRCRPLSMLSRTSPAGGQAMIRSVIARPPSGLPGGGRSLLRKTAVSPFGRWAGGDRLPGADSLGYRPLPPGGSTAPRNDPSARPTVQPSLGMSLSTSLAINHSAVRASRRGRRLNHSAKRANRSARRAACRQAPTIRSSKSSSFSTLRT